MPELRKQRYPNLGLGTIVLALDRYEGLKVWGRGGWGKAFWGKEMFIVFDQAGLLGSKGFRYRRLLTNRAASFPQYLQGGSVEPSPPILVQV